MKKLPLLLAAAVLTVSVHAQAPATPAPAAKPPAAPAKPVAMNERKVLKDLSEAILIEQKFLQVLTDAKPTLTETVQRDMTKSTSELKRVWTALATLATAKSVELAAEVPKADVAKIDKLAKEKPDKFVKEFFKDYSKETAKTVKIVDSAKTVQDPEIKIFFEDWGTVLKSHATAAQAGEKSATAKK